MLVHFLSVDPFEMTKEGGSLKLGEKKHVDMEIKKKVTKCMSLFQIYSIYLGTAAEINHILYGFYHILPLLAIFKRWI